MFVAWIFTFIPPTFTWNTFILQKMSHTTLGISDRNVLAAHSYWWPGAPFKPDCPTLSTAVSRFKDATSVVSLQLLLTGKKLLDRDMMESNDCTANPHVAARSAEADAVLLLDEHRDVMRGKVANPAAIETETVFSFSWTTKLPITFQAS